MKQIVTAMLLCLALPLMAEDFVEGRHYMALETPQATSSGDRVEVLEFFSYGCSHCNEFEETLGPWVEELPETVAFQRVPAGLGRGFFQQMAAAYHVASELDVLDTMHPVLFSEIHDKRNQSIASLAGLAKVFSQHSGVSEEKFMAALNSETVRQNFARTEQMMPKYGLRGVPAMVVNGRYYVSRNEHVPSYEKMLEVVDHLIAMEGKD